MGEIAGDQRHRPHLKLAVKTWLCGFLMGIADVVPGVSGGTVALILGIYRRLITAISHVDRQLFQLLRVRKLAEAAKYLDFWFLLLLLGGIAAGFVLTILTVAKLLNDAAVRPFVLAVFFGLILGSAYHVTRLIRLDKHSSGVNWIALAVGVLVAATICWMSPNSVEQPQLWYVFVCGMIAICAMILPGISGALILLLMGLYVYMVDVVEAVLHGESWGTNLPIAMVFSVGCLIGLLAFSKILRRLLAHKPATTMSFLSGLMLGSLFKLWPFQIDLTPHREDFKHKVFQAAWPERLDLMTAALLVTMVLGTLAVVGLDLLASKYAAGGGHPSTSSTER